MSKGLFQVWQEIFQIHQPKVKRFEDLNDGAKLKKNNFMNLGDDVADSRNIDTSFKGRSRRILNTVHSAGDYEKYKYIYIIYLIKINIYIFRDIVTKYALNLPFLD